MDIFESIRQFPYVLAPLAGYTDSPFRKIAKKFGASFVWTEMINEHTMARFHDRIEPLYRYDEEEHPIGMQLFGKEPALFGEAAARAQALGFDAVDINFGCPARAVTNGGSGSAMMKDINKAEAIVKAVVGAVKIPVGIKIRSGWDDSHRNFMDFNKMAEDNGVSFICLHPRTRAQMFREHSNWDELKRLKQESRLFVTGSGDIMTAADALRMKKETEVDAVMVARGAMNSPFIFKEIKEPGYQPSFRERIELASFHYEEMLKYRGHRAVFEMRKYFGRYLKGFNNAVAARVALFKMDDEQQIREFLKQLPELEEKGEMVK
ncbi:MAG: tRNA dihydrouridine synthase DusB [Candidatus Goldiibacteriota bacterium HGW-Goldbacteria-1]|jgi:nifR3 family TIM-barrel protein|nr:MAG: tRNA dihydrouridine synthase DusB [Candidatus Goldiibacteriota bacterium HGW-Goldbacteria-1]